MSKNAQQDGDALNLERVETYALVDDAGDLDHDLAESMLSGFCESGMAVSHAGIVAVRAPQDRRVFRMYADGERVGTLNMRTLISGAAIVEAFAKFAEYGAAVVDGDAETDFSEI